MICNSPPSPPPPQAYAGMNAIAGPVHYPYVPTPMLQPPTMLPPVCVEQHPVRVTQDCGACPPSTHVANIKLAQSRTAQLRILTHACVVWRLVRRPQASSATPHLAVVRAAKTHSVRLGTRVQKKGNARTSMGEGGSRARRTASVQRREWVLATCLPPHMKGPLCHQVAGRTAAVAA